MSVGRSGKVSAEDGGEGQTRRAASFSSPGGVLGIGGVRDGMLCPKTPVLRP